MIEDWASIFFLCVQIVSAVQYCHQKCIVHRDLKVHDAFHTVILYEWVKDEKGLSVILF